MLVAAHAVDARYSLYMAAKSRPPRLVSHNSIARGGIRWSHVDVCHVAAMDGGQEGPSSSGRRCIRATEPGTIVLPLGWCGGQSLIAGWQYMRSFPFLITRRCARSGPFLLSGNSVGRSFAAAPKKSPPLTETESISLGCRNEF